MANSKRKVCLECSQLSSCLVEKENNSAGHKYQIRCVENLTSFFIQKISLNVFCVIAASAIIVFKHTISIKLKGVQGCINKNGVDKLKNPTKAADKKIKTAFLYLMNTIGSRDFFFFVQHTSFLSLFHTNYFTFFPKIITDLGFIIKQMFSINSE